MAEIILSTLNSRYSHCAFGLRYLFANLGELQTKARILEFEIKSRPLEIAEKILAEEPRIVGLGVYVWNAKETLELASHLKRIAPQVKLVLGGPEISHEIEQQQLTTLADYVIAGEGDAAFAALCAKLLEGEAPAAKIIRPLLPELSTLLMPYRLYTDDDVAHRIIYVEASRGCPFECDFCLSALDERVRSFPLDPFLDEMKALLDRGVRHFKFVDRTFNLSPKTSSAILRFFLENYAPGLFLHFEMVPDRLPKELRREITGFPPHSMQFEVGVQTFDAGVAERIGRRQDYEKIEENLRWLRQETTVHIHADLIAGLPGEPLTVFGSGFDKLFSLSPHEIQVGILKRLRGAPIARHDSAWGMVYSEYPPYEILKTSAVAFADMQRLRRFARFWDLYSNSGNFTAGISLLLGSDRSPFESFLKFSDWLYSRLRRTSEIALQSLEQSLLEYVVRERRHEPAQMEAALSEDALRRERRRADARAEAGHTKRQLFHRAQSG